MNSLQNGETLLNDITNAFNGNMAFNLSNLIDSFYLA